MLQAHHFVEEKSGSLKSARFYPNVCLFTSDLCLDLYSSLCPNLELCSGKTWLHAVNKSSQRLGTCAAASPNARRRAGLCSRGANRQDPWGLEIACSIGSGKKTREESTADTGETQQTEQGFRGTENSTITHNSQQGPS